MMMRMSRWRMCCLDNNYLASDREFLDDAGLACIISRGITMELRVINRRVTKYECP